MRLLRASAAIVGLLLVGVLSRGAEWDRPISEQDKDDAREAQRRETEPAPAKPLSSLPKPRLVFFPPVAPLYGAPILEPKTDYRFNGVPVTAPIELTDYVGENFYAPLSTHFWDGDLPPKLAARLHAYTTARNVLVNELRDVLETLQLADAATREEQLRRFAPTQSQRLAALETEAEELRRELLRPAQRDRPIDWNVARGWRLDTLAHPNPLVLAAAEHQVARAGAYYTDGLGVEQRWLLREIAMELFEVVQSKMGRRPSAELLTAIFFSPATGRFNLPKKMPADLTAKIGAYNGRKAALKTELREALFRLEGENSAPNRTTTLAQLSDRQWPAVAELEEMAEEIRRGLALLPPLGAPPLPPPLPPALVEEIEAYKRDRREFDARRREQLMAVGSVPMRLSGLLNGSPEERREMILRASAEREEHRRTAIATFDLENAESQAALKKRAESLRRALEAFAGIWPDPQTGKPMDAPALLRNYELSNQAFDAFGRREVIYREYRIAMLQPGLSPAQRRLLFAAAVGGLAQPLPMGESFPSKLNRTPVMRY